MRRLGIFIEEIIFMNLLIVCSGNKNKINSFISEQAEAVSNLDVRVYYFLIKGKGITGYLKNRRELIKYVRANNIDIIHAHYGLSGLLAVLQRNVPVIVTFHGSDINQRKTRYLSRLASLLSSHNIFVEKSFADKLKSRGKYTLLPCGVDLDNFRPLEKTEARKFLSWNEHEKIVLFSSAFRNSIKNYPLAKAAVRKVPNARLVELHGYSRSEVNVLMNAADVLLLTSLSEGSPQVVKEALACNLPIVSVPVGDVPVVTIGVSGVKITSYESDDIAIALKQILSNNKRSNGRTAVAKFDNKLIASALVAIYRRALS